MTTEVVQREVAGELAIPDDPLAGLVQKYVGLDPTVDIGELIAAAVGDDDGGLRRKDFDRIRVPSETSSAFEVPDMDAEDGTRPEKVITGIVVHWFKSRSFWTSREATGARPDCSSWDNKAPIADGLFGPLGLRAHRNEGGTCETCLMSRFGSGRDEKGKKTRGQACKQSMSLLMLLPGEMVPVIVQAPATSLAEIRSFLLKAALKKRTIFYGMEVALKLVKDANETGQKYNKIVPTLVRVLDPDELARVREYKTAIIDPMVKTFTTNPESMAVADENFDDELYEPVPGEVDEDAEVDDEKPAARGARSKAPA